MGDTMAVVSDNLMTVTVVVYSLAMLGYAAEFAFGRVARSAHAGSEQRVLVGAGARAEGTESTGTAEIRERGPTAPSAAAPAEPTGTAATVGRFAAVLTDRKSVV